MSQDLRYTFFCVVHGMTMQLCVPSCYCLGNYGFILILFNTVELPQFFYRSLIKLSSVLSCFLLLYEFIFYLVFCYAVLWHIKFPFV